jgi:hypothetical protein
MLWLDQDGDKKGEEITDVKSGERRKEKPLVMSFQQLTKLK